MQKKFFFLACFFICAECLAQQYPFVQYTPKDGLVNSRVRKTYQDSKGRMYFLTYGGLSVYDGTRFMNYTRQEGLPNDVINDVLEISNDTILVATNTNKVNILVHGRIGVYPASDNYFPLINRFLKSSDGKIYVASDGGLFVLEGHKFARLPVNDKKGNDIGLYFDKISEWNNYFLLIPWDERIEKLILYDRVKRKTADIYASPSVFSAAVDRSNYVWLTTYGGIQFLDKDSLQHGKISLTGIPPEYSAISSKESLLPFFDREGSTWLYSGNTIMKISPQQYEQVISPEHGLKAASVLNLFEDREGTIWMATDGSGVIKMRGSNIQLISAYSPGKALSASSIAQQGDTLWIYNSGDNSILQLYNNETKKFQLPANCKAGRIYLQDKKMYITNSTGIFSIRDKNNPSLYSQPEPLTGKPDDELLGCAVSDRSGAFIQHSTRRDSVYFLRTYVNNKMVSQNTISFMADKMILDDQQRLWVAPRDNHLSVFALHPEQPGQYLQLLKDYAKELPDMGARSITEDRQGNIWIGTRYNGVYRLELSGLRLISVKQFTTRDGLTDNFVYSMICDRDNNLWVGTQSGLDKIFFKDDRYVISNVSKSNGFFQAIHQLAVTNDNTIWAVTSEATILKVEQTSLPDTLSPPPLLLSLGEVNNKPVDDSASGFSYRQNNFTFNVAAPSFFDEKSILYSYQLEGSGNANWSTPSHNPLLTFSNLAPGHYTLHAKAQFPDATYAPRIASYAFTITPPWWETLLFRLIAASAAMGLLIIATQLYYRRKLEKQRIILEKQQAIEKERTRIATDMHDDLGAGLSRIKFLSETIGMKKQQQLPIEEDINKIREYSHEMIDKMGEIVWALNEKNDSLSDLLSYTRSYAAEYLAQNGIECIVSSPGDLSSAFVSGEFRRNVFLAVKEILHNVVKHSQAARVTIDMNVNHRLRIQISDDGIGFERSGIRPFSNGLPNIEKRMKDIGGLVEIQSGAGTKVKLDIPLSS